MSPIIIGNTILDDYVVVFVADGKLIAVQGPNANKTFTASSGESANGKAAVVNKIDGLYVAFPVNGARAAAFTTDAGIPNSNLTFTARASGPGGNSIRVRYTIAGANQPLTVSVLGTDITIGLATNASSVPTSSANAIKAAVEAHNDATALVTVTNAFEEDGTGIPDVAMPFMTLWGGSTGGATASQATVLPTATTNPGTF